MDLIEAIGLEKEKVDGILELSGEPCQSDVLRIGETRAKISSLERLNRVSARIQPFGVSQRFAESIELIS